jgi:hypothetical protein
MINKCLHFYSKIALVAETAIALEILLKNTKNE